MMSSPLDDSATYRQLDGEGMGQHLRQLPQQCQAAWEQALSLDLPPWQGIERVVVAGMGGSATGGDLVRGLARREGKLVLLHQDYGPVPFLDSHTLAIFSSYSGMTEETLSCFQTSLDSPGPKIAFTSGGQLRKLALSRGVPLFPIDYSAPPRAAIGFSFFGLLGLLQRTGFLQDKTAEVKETISILKSMVERLDPPQPLSRNPAKALAQELKGRLALCYGAGFLEPVARRWKTQINENSKAWAFWDAFPELNHNAVVGYRFPPALSHEFRVVMLSSPLLHPRTQLRYGITGEILSQQGIDHRVLQGEGSSPLSQAMSLLLLGDYVSYYLAMLNGVDPTATPPIIYLKERMGQHGLQV